MRLSNTCNYSNDLDGWLHDEQRQRILFILRRQRRDCYLYVNLNLPSMNNTTKPDLEHFFQTTSGKAVTTVFLSLVIVFTACGNGLVLWALKRFIYLRRPGHIYLGGLALADCCMILPLLLKITNTLNKNTTVCVAQGVSELVVVCCISLHLGCISIERFISIKFALRYDVLITKQKVYTSIIVLWIVSLLTAFIIPLIISKISFSSTHFENLADGILTLCSPNVKYRMSQLPQTVFAYAVFMLVFFFCLPCITILVSYTYIFVASFRQRQKIVKLDSQNDDESRWNVVVKRLVHEFKAAKTVFIIQTLFIITYFPYFAVVLTRVEMNDDTQDSLLFLLSKALSFFTALTSCLNPVIYVWGNEQFKIAFKKLLKIPVEVGSNQNASQN